MIEQTIIKKMSDGQEIKFEVIRSCCTDKWFAKSKNLATGEVNKSKVFLESRDAYRWVLETGAKMEKLS